MEFPNTNDYKITEECMFNLFLKVARLFKNKKYFLNFEVTLRTGLMGSNETSFEVSAFDEEGHNASATVYSFYSKVKAYEWFKIIKESTRKKTIKEIEKLITEHRGF